MNVRADLYSRPRVRRVLWGAFVERLALSTRSNAVSYLNAISALALSRHASTRR
jgi:hypothetical protein